MKKLSIIVPVYNSQKYLRRCIESVVNQMREWVELIIVDDGSTDDSPYICDEYKMIDNISVIHKKNGGLSSARNAGLEIATGDYVFFLDSDDLIDGSLINDLEKYFDEDWDFLNFGYCFEKEENQFNPKGTKNTKILNQMEFIDLYCKNRYGNQICFRIYKKELFENIKFPYGKYYEDIATFYKIMLEAKKIMLVDYEYYIYNISNQSSITKKINRKCLGDMLTAIDEMYNGLLQCYDKNDNMRFLEYCKINQYIYILFKLVKCDEDVEDLKDHILKYLKNKKIGIKYLKYYNYKKYIVFKLLNLFRIIK